MPRQFRSNPKTKNRAITLRKASTPAEQKLWSQLRNDQLGVTFRRHTAPAVGAGGMPSETILLTSLRQKRNWSSNWMAANT